MTAIRLDARPRRHRSGTAGPRRHTLAVARRSVLQFVRTPQLIVVGTLQGAMFLLIFRYVFGGAIHTGPMPYVDFLVPGFVVTSVLFAGMGAAAGVAEDLDARLLRPAALAAGPAHARCSPAARSPTPAAGVEPRGHRRHRLRRGVPPARRRRRRRWPRSGCACVFGFAFTWLFICIGSFAGSAQAAQGMSLLVFPLTFVSSAYVPVASMPGWLQPFAEHQPITYMVDAVRALTLGSRVQVELGHPASYYIARALVWTAAILAVAVPLAVAKYRRG